MRLSVQLTSPFNWQSLLAIVLIQVRVLARASRINLNKHPVLLPDRVYITGSEDNLNQSARLSDDYAMDYLIEDSLAMISSKVESHRHLMRERMRRRMDSFRRSVAPRPGVGVLGNTIVG
jgi:hypothetical protein